MTIPKKLQKGDEIRIIAPSRSLALLSDEIVREAKKNLEKLGYKVTFSKNSYELDKYHSSSVRSRVDDIHDAYSDKNVKAIFATIGGFNSNQLLKYLDYDLIKKNPKILCGYSDITALSNAITAKTSTVTYSGPNFSLWAMKKEFQYNLEYFKKCLLQTHEFKIEPSDSFTDDSWYKDQENRNIVKNSGYIILNKGEGSGRIFGGNLCTFNLLQGTEFMPDISDSILFLEDDDLLKEYTDIEFDRNLQSLIHLPNFHKVKALVIGRFQRESCMNEEKLKDIIYSKIELKNIPIIANVDFGHTNPMITFPIGGEGYLRVDEEIEFRIIRH